MGTRISGRSLQDDSFAAEESVDRRSRVMGEEFADHHLEEAPADSRGVADEMDGDTDPTEDPGQFRPALRVHARSAGQSCPSSNPSRAQR